LEYVLVLVFDLLVSKLVRMTQFRITWSKSSSTLSCL